MACASTLSTRAIAEATSTCLRRHSHTDTCSNNISRTMAVRHVKKRAPRHQSSPDSPIAVLPHAKRTASSPRFSRSFGDLRCFVPKQTPVVRGSLHQIASSDPRASDNITTRCGIKAAASAMTGRSLLLSCCHWFVHRPRLGGDRAIGTGACLTTDPLARDKAVVWLGNATRFGLPSGHGWSDVK